MLLRVDFTLFMGSRVCHAWPRFIVHVWICSVWIFFCYSWYRATHSPLWRLRLFPSPSVIFGRTTIQIYRRFAELCGCVAHGQWVMGYISISWTDSVFLLWIWAGLIVISQPLLCIRCECELCLACVCVRMTCDVVESLNVIFFFCACEHPDSVIARCCFAKWASVEWKCWCACNLCSTPGGGTLTDEPVLPELVISLWELLTEQVSQSA